MERLALYKDLSLEAVNFETLVKDIARKFLSGYFKIVYWDYEDYLVYMEGSPVYGVRVNRMGGRELLNARAYRPAQSSGTLYFYEIPITNLLLFINEDKFPPNPYSFVGYGNEFLSCVRASHVDWNRLLEQIKRSHIDGYLVVCSKGGFKGVAMLQKGQFMGVYGVREEGGRVKLSLNKERDYVAVYHTGA